MNNLAQITKYNEKLTEQVTQNLEVCGKKRKIDDFKKGVQDFSNYQNPSKKPRENFKCVICSKSYKKSGNLKQHIESAHEEKSYKCDLCSSKFTEKVNLKKHIESVHT